LDIQKAKLKERSNMLSKIQKWGNSQGIRIPKNLLENWGIPVGREEW